MTRITPDDYVVAISRNGRRYAWIDKGCSTFSRDGNYSACTGKLSRAKRWKFRNGAERAARAYEKNNPGHVCTPARSVDEPDEMAD